MRMSSPELSATRAYLLLVLLTSLLLTCARTQARSATETPPEWEELCGFEVCDRRSEYCDDLLQTCASCERECHPTVLGAITRDADVEIERCRRVCSGQASLPHV